LGAAGIANAKVAYTSFKKIFSGPRWDSLAVKGAQVQRVLWASTSVKSPKYRDTRYVEEMIGPNTVDTMPLETLTAFREHGRVRPSLEEDIDGARGTLIALEGVGVSMKEVTDKLLQEGIEKFVEPYTTLLKTMERRCREARRPIGSSATR
jgi:transaldolase